VLQVGARIAEEVIRANRRHQPSHPRRLIDEYLLMIHPLVLGSGQRLFDHHDDVAKLQLVASVATTTGVIIATYQPA
jgi:dihydrofolate reductase